MDIPMRVHSIATHPVEVEVDYNGEKARAMIPEMTIELLDVGAGHGSFAPRFRSRADMAAAKEMFHLGDLVTLTISKAAPAAIETKAEEPAA
jgi:hypothetical protein